MNRNRVILLSLLMVLAVTVSACGSATTPTTGPQPTQPVADPPTKAPEPTAVPPEPAMQLSGDIAVDGSSTVFPITEAMAEEFGATYGDVRIAVGISGTGGGFKKFCNGETDIQDASRAIKDSEKEACAATGIEYTELLVGLDGLSVVVNPANDLAQCLTVEQLKTIWDQGSTVKNWSEVDPSFQDQPLALYGPGTDSGTFDFFTEVVNGVAKQSRADYTASEDDNVLVQGVAGDEGALGYFGMAYYLENADKLKAVSIDSGKGCVAPSFETVADGTYAPLSRPLYIYVKNASLARPEVYEFVKFYLANAPTIVPAVDYVAVDQSVYDEDMAKLEAFQE